MKKDESESAKKRNAMLSRQRKKRNTMLSRQRNPENKRENKDKDTGMGGKV